MYGNENEVGEGLKEAFDSGIKREDIFVTSKLWNTYHQKPEECLDEGLKRLGLDYIDLYLIHWPVPMNPNGNHPLFPKHPDGSRDLDTRWSHVDTWKNMEKLLDTGKVKAIGVSNYSVKFLEELLPQAKVVPAANQIENHPLLPQQDIADYCKSKGILIEAYSPLGSTGSPLFADEGVKEVAKKHGVGEGTVLINYQGELPHPYSQHFSGIPLARCLWRRLLQPLYFSPLSSRSLLTLCSRERTRCSSKVCDTEAHRREPEDRQPRLWRSRGLELHSQDEGHNEICVSSIWREPGLPRQAGVGLRYHLGCYSLHAALMMQSINVDSEIKSHAPSDVCALFPS